MAEAGKIHSPPAGRQKERPDQRFNRVVDISPYIERKIDAIVECKSQGGGVRGAVEAKR